VKEKETEEEEKRERDGKGKRKETESEGKRAKREKNTMQINNEENRWHISSTGPIELLMIDSK